MNWLVEHSFLVGALVIAILDFVFAIKPDWKSSGLLHWLYMVVTKRVENNGDR